MKRLQICCIVFFSFLNLSSQNAEEKWNVGIHSGLDEYNGDLGNAWYTREQAAYGFGGASISRYLNRRLDASMLITYGELGYMGNYIQSSDMAATNSFRARIATTQFHLRLHLVDRERVVAPYLFAGAGIMSQKQMKAAPRRPPVEVTLPVAGPGLMFRFGPVASLQVQEIFMYPWKDDVDGKVKGGNDMYLFHCIGLTFNVSKWQRKPEGSRAGSRIDKCDDLFKDPKKVKSSNTRTKARLRKK